MALSLSSSQIADFKRDGFLHLPGFIPTDLVEGALRAINHEIGQGVPAEELPIWRSQSWFPAVARTPVITDLFNESGLRPLLQTLMGQNSVAPLKNGQLALRFPSEAGAELRPPRWHIDGIHSPHNGVPAGSIHSFSALVGVFLTDVEGENAGNFTVWPGSHLKIQDYFREHGLETILRENQTPPIERGEPLQIKARAGDAVIAHYQLLHGVAENHAPRPRHTVFFRLMHPDHASHRLECLTDLWREWPGVRESQIGTG